MASQEPTTHHQSTEDLEKETSQVHSEHFEHHNEKHNDLHKVGTLGVDLDNSEAVKGDDSDGRVNWTPLQIVATVSLSGLYVG